MTPSPVGFIGLGTMGLPQALRIAAQGRPVVVYDARPDVTAAAARHAGVEAASSPRAVAERCELILTCLPDDAAVDAVFRGEEGLLRALRRGALTCDLSTVSPAFTAALAAELEAAGVTHFTAPMLGSKPQAEAGQVFYILGGPAAELERIAPVLALSGRQHIHVGDAAAANKVKLLHNALGAVNYAAVAEALALCVANGVDVQTFYDVVRNGGGMAFGNYFDRKVPTIAAGDYSPRFKLKLAHKDSKLAQAFFAEQAVPMPIHDAARALLDDALAAGFGEDDASAVTKVLEQRLGKPIRGG
jgi:3-hydroxyisobutyrate dehydrogenase-like beta-hydroxyacid dehydrogenase